MHFDPQRTVSLFSDDLNPYVCHSFALASLLSADTQRSTTSLLRFNERTLSCHHHHNVSILFGECVNESRVCWWCERSSFVRLTPLSIVPRINGRINCHIYEDSTCELSLIFDGSFPYPLFRICSCWLYELHGGHRNVFTPMHFGCSSFSVIGTRFSNCYAVCLDFHCVPYLGCARYFSQQRESPNSNAGLRFLRIFSCHLVGVGRF